MVWWCSTRASIPAPALAASSVIPADRRPQIRGWGEGIGTLCRKSLIPKRDTTSHENVADPITNDLRGYFQGNFVANFVDERRECWDFDKAVSDIMFSQKTSWDRL